MPEASLHLSNVTFRFGTQSPLFENLSCSFSNGPEDGRIIALMGPSGVGKTTFCDLALGIRRPQEGRVSFDPATAHLAVIPQKGVIFDELSIKDNISCLKFSKSLGETFREDKVQYAIESLGLGFAVQNATKASALSGGEAQRVMLARIQTVTCDILILDEPCSFLDNRVKDSFLSALRKIVDECQMLALMVTHVWDEVRFVADEVVFFHQVSRKPVTLHQARIQDAWQMPPTVDALFSIYWPNCLLLDISEISTSTDAMPSGFPESASQVGLFLNAHPPSRYDDWARHMWTQMGRLPTEVDSRQARQEAESGPIAVQCVFYDANGVALRDEP